MRIRGVDAFADRPFAGNPAAVCVLPDGPWPEQSWMQSVAAEMNLSETAFGGSAHTALASYWAQRLGRDELVGCQLSARGGVLQVTAAGDRVRLGGKAVTVLDGELLV